MGVIKQNGAWRLAYNGMQVGRYVDQQQAITAAARLAKMVAESGGRSEILLNTQGFRLEPLSDPDSGQP